MALWLLFFAMGAKQAASSTSQPQLVKQAVRAIKKGEAQGNARSRD